jgi:hypothetical protein
MAMAARCVTAALGLCACFSISAHAQSAVGGLTTGAAIPESEPLPSDLAVERSQTATVGVTVGLGETDNVALTPTDRRSQTMELTGIDFGWIRTGSALDANVVGDFNYLDYLQGAYGSQLLGRFDGLTSLSLFSDHLKWFLQDDFGEGQLDPYTPATPTNLENINVVTTGPDITLRPMSDTVVQLGARYARATYETSPFDGYRMVENVLLERLLSSSSNVALGADVQELRFDNTTVNTDYDRSRYYVQYDITGSRTHITATLGETQVNDSGNWYSTPLAQLELTHEISAQTRLNLTAGRELTDAADTFDNLRSGAAGGIAVAPVAETTGDYLRNYVTGGLQLTGQRTTVGLTADWERDTYTVDDTFDVTRGSLELRLSRQLSSILNGSIFGTLMQSRYFNQFGDINSHIIGADITWQASRMLSVEGRYAHDFQSTSGGGFGYSANTIFVTVTYRPVQQNPPQPLQQNPPL